MIRNFSVLVSAKVNKKNQKASFLYNFAPSTEKNER